MAIPEGADDHALHGASANDGLYAQASPAPARTRARGSVAKPARDATSLTERNLARLQERWGTPITEPVDDPTPEDEDDVPFGIREVLHGISVHLHLIRDPLPSMRAVNADYKVGLERAQQQSATAAGLYRAVGRAGHAAGFLFRFLAANCDRPGRFAALLVILALFTGSAWWAGLIF
ncbi:hypothetical protein GCM10023196_036450 [Actinoallomurus vinaceus]|uniref:Uncharacterized protein n=1 Tax=Actinoallomurus vinaceus TaxID=1080074 RepID=A0ABP8UAQ2_9ACTN